MLRYDPDDPDWPKNEDRDRFLLSTGHYSIVLWAALTAIGLYPEEMLASYGADENLFGMSTVADTPGYGAACRISSNDEILKQI